MASGASKLENELVAFVEGHPETFSHQDIVNLRRNIIASFAIMEVSRPNNRGGVGGLASMITGLIEANLREKTIITSHDVKYALTQFDLGADFLKTYLTPLCNTEVAHISSGYDSMPTTPRQLCLKTGDTIQHGGTMWSLVNKKINEYHVKVLKLWADVLIRDGTITQAAIAETRTAGYVVKYDQLHQTWNAPHGIKSSLDESILLEYLTLVHVATPEQLLAHPGQVSYTVFSIISQFVPLNMINGTPDFQIPTGKHNSELNVLRLTCDVVAKPIQRTPGIAPDVQSPVLAYLSSDMLDKCVQSVGQFPTTDQFIQYMNERMIEKAAAFSAPPPSAAPPPPPPPASAPPLSEIDGGRKNTRRKAKKNKNVRRSHRH
jgi:hypothetical protein